MKRITQIEARATNQKLVLRLLENQILTNSEIAETLQLSSTAVDNILKELCELRLVHCMETEKLNVRGRPAKKYRIEQEKFMLINVDFSTDNLEITAANLAQECLAVRNMPNRFQIDLAVYEEIGNEIADLLEQFADRELLVITLGVCGNFAKDSNIMRESYRFTYFQGKDVTEYFAERFHVRTICQNHVALALQYEMRGAAKADAFLLHLDIGVGAAIYLDGKIREGRGYSGAVGEFRYVNDPQTLEEKCSLKRLYSDLRALGYNPGKISDIAQDLINQESRVCQVVDSIADYVTNAFVNCYLLLDMDRFSIIGRLAGLGEVFLQKIREKFASILKTKQYRNAVRIEYAVNERGSVLGGLRLAAEQGEDLLLQKREFNIRYL